jgi:PLP dependent protein
MTAAPDRASQLATALAIVSTRLAQAAENVGRKPEEIELLPVTKFFPATDIAILMGLGCRSFGESRDQEAVHKIAMVATLTPEPAPALRWQMVGQIQRNKARSVAGWADTAHSVGTAKVVNALDRAAGAALAEGARTEPLHVYVQLSLDGDISRGGVDIDDPRAVDDLCAQVAASDALTLVGLMAIPPLDVDADAAFARLSDEHRRVLRDHPAATGLSAGMSADLEVAVKHGSTCVRVGTALMGPRPLTSP